MSIFLRLLPWTLCLVALLPAAAQAAGTDAGKAKAVASCPDLVERLAFEVTPISPEDQKDIARDDWKDANLRVKVPAGATEKLMREAGTVSAQLSASSSAGARKELEAQLDARLDRVDYAPLKGMDEMVITGLVNWMENRAAAEIRLWVIDSLKDRLCENESAYFPETCQVLEANDKTLSTAYSGEALVSSLRSDIPYVPACAIHNRINSPVGYQLLSVYNQFIDNKNLESLLYGLANKPGGNGGAKVSAEHGRLLLPLFAYAALLDAMPYRKSDPDFALELFEVRFETYRANAGLCTEGACDPGINKSRFLATVDAIAKERDKLAKAIRKLQELKDAKPEQWLPWLRKVGVVTTDILAVVTDGMEKSQANTEAGNRFRRQLDAADHYLGALLRAHNAINRRDYASALAELVPMTTCLADPDGTKTCEAIVKNTDDASYEWLLRGAYTAALLADADDAGDFEQTLDELASPVGAYRRRHDAPMLSVNGYLGADLSYNRIRVYGQNSPDIKDSYVAAEIFAPVGITYTRPSCWRWLGACGLHFQVLNVGVLAGDYRGRVRGDGYTLDSDTETKFRSVFSPGAYFVFSPFPRAPVTFGLGYQRGPYDYKSGTLANGVEATADRTWAATAFMAVDLVIFGF